MITAQQMEIQGLTTILNGQTVNNSVPAFTMELSDHMMKMDQVSDVQLITGDIDNDFATLMIQHHNSAIENSEAYLMYGNNTQLKALAQKMIDDQKKEIKELSDWLRNNGKRWFAVKPVREIKTTTGTFFIENQKMFFVQPENDGCKKFYDKPDVYLLFFNT